MIPHSKPYLDSLDAIALNKTINSGMLSSGRLNLEFKNAISKNLSKEYVSLFSSASSGLFHVLTVLKTEKKNEVLLPNYICCSVYKSIKLAGLQPVLYDNRTNDWVSDYNQINKRITDRTLAIIINHTFGIYMKDIEILKNKGVFLIEDCCHVFSNSIAGREISRYSICSVYSFDATKWVATGNGGAIATNNESLFREIEKQKVDQGLPDVLCALGLSQLEKVEEFIEKRYSIAQKYFKEMPYITKDLSNKDSIFFRFPIFIENTCFFLNNTKIAFRKGVDELLNKKFDIAGDFANSELVFSKTISIPIYPALTEKEVEIIIDETHRIYEISTTR